MAKQLNQAPILVQTWDGEGGMVVEFDWPAIATILTDKPPGAPIDIVRIVAAAYGQGRVDAMAGAPSKIPSGHEVPAVVARALMATQT